MAFLCWDEHLDREDEAGKESDRDEDLSEGHRAVSLFDVNVVHEGLRRLRLVCLAIYYIAGWPTP